MRSLSKNLYTKKRDASQHTTITMLLLVSKTGGLCRKFEHAKVIGDKIHFLWLTVQIPHSGLMSHFFVPL